MRRIASYLVCLILLAVTLSTGGAEAAKKKNVQRPLQTWQQPMKVVIVRSSEKGCEPYCPEWIMAEGQINNQTPVEFQKALAKAADRKLPVVIHSPGGDIVASVQIGLMIRRAGLSVAVGRTVYEGCGPFSVDCPPPVGTGGKYLGRAVSALSFCVSACPLILAAGAQRIAAGNTLIGVHKVRYFKYPLQAPAPGSKQKNPELQVSRDYRTLTRNILSDYLANMGVSLGLLDDMEKASGDNLYMLTPKRRKALQLIAEKASVEALTSRKICAGKNVPDYCEWPVAPDDFAPKVPTYRDAFALARIPPAEKPMAVYVMRHAARTCEPSCPQWIVASGVITPETAAKFATVLDQIGDAKLPVLIDSSGGDLDAALAIGRMIYKRGLAVAVAQAETGGCLSSGRQCAIKNKNGLAVGVPRMRAEHCYGVCIFILAAGQQRMSSITGVLALQNVQIYVSRRSPRKSMALLKKYLAEIGFGQGLIETAGNIEMGKTRILPLEETRQLSLQTTEQSAAQFLWPGYCAHSDAPLHCIKYN